MYAAVTNFISMFYELCVYNRCHSTAEHQHTHTHTYIRTKNINKKVKKNINNKVVKVPKADTPNIYIFAQLFNKHGCLAEIPSCWADDAKSGEKHVIRLTKHTTRIDKNNIFKAVYTHLQLNIDAAHIKAKHMKQITHI